MSLRRLSIFAALAAACSLASAVCRRATEAIAAFGRLVIRFLADRPDFRTVTHRVADFLTLPRRAYVGPPGGLPFNAGRATLAAPRHI